MGTYWFTHHAALTFALAASHGHGTRHRVTHAHPDDPLAIDPLGRRQWHVIDTRNPIGNRTTEPCS